MLKFFHILFFVILISCSNRNENDINDISNKLNTIKLQFEKLDPNLVVIALEGYKSNSKMIKNCVDSIEKEFNYRFVQYKTIKKVSPQFLNIYNTCKKNISFERAMSNLHGILNNGNIIKGLDVLAYSYELIGLGWVYFPTKIPIISNLLKIFYSFWAKYRLKITGRNTLNTLCDSKCKEVL